MIKYVIMDMKGRLALILVVIKDSLERRSLDIS